MLGSTVPQGTRLHGFPGSIIPASPHPGNDSASALCISGHCSLLPPPFLIFCSLCKAGGSCQQNPMSYREQLKLKITVQEEGDLVRLSYHRIPHVLTAGKALQVCPPHEYLNARNPKDELNHPLESTAPSELSENHAAALNRLWRRMLAWGRGFLAG